MSDIYHVIINEILSGERLIDQSFKEAAEENVAILLEDTELKKKKFEKNMLILMGITSILCVIIFVLLPKGTHLTTIDKIKEVTIVIVLLIIVTMSQTFNIMTIVLRKNQ